MHTFFINTSEKIAGLSNPVRQAYRGILFEKQEAEKNLIILRNSVSVDELDTCAEEIATMIDQEADIYEDTALAVYMESKIRMDDSSYSPQPRVVAEETLLSLKAEAALVWKLCDMGKRPRELVFIFGESIKRDEIMEDDDVFRMDMRKELWEGICLPPVSEVLKYIRESTDENSLAAEEESADDEINPNRSGKEEKPRKKYPEITEQALIGVLKKNTEGKMAIITQHDKYCYDDIISHLAKMIEYQIETALWEIDEEVIYNCLGNAVETFTQTLLRDQIIGRYAVSVRYMYMPLEYRDYHEEQRNACRLMMYLYGITQEGNEKGYLNLEIQEDQINRQRTENGPQHACLMPEVDYKRLANLLNYKRICCQNSSYVPAVPPDELNHRVENGDKLINSDHEIPVLIPKKYIRGDSDSSGKISMISDYLRRGIMSTASLRKAVEKTLQDILDKDANNTKQIREYMNRVTAEYDRIKDDGLKKIAYTEKLTNITESGDENTDKRIDDLQNMENKVNGLMIEAEKELLKEPPRLIPTKSVKEQVKEVRAQTEYYLTSLKRSILILAVAIAFIAAVMIPYLLTMKWILTSLPGYLFIIITAAVALGSLAAGYICFSAVYKYKIKSMVRKLCVDFTLAQKQNQDCLNTYTDFLYKKVPRYYALSRYQSALHDYKEQTKLRKEKITFHNRSRKEWTNLIWVLIDNLDIKREIDPIPEDEIETARIDPEKDRTENGEIYTLSAMDVSQILRIKEELSA